MSEAKLRISPMIQLQFVKVTGHLYDASGQPVAVTGCCYADPMDIEPRSYIYIR